MLLSALVSTCPYARAVSGGLPAPAGSVPAYATLFQLYVDRNGKILPTQAAHLLCGGVLVAPDRVLTAAHCASAAVRIVIGEQGLTKSAEMSRNKASESFEVIGVAALPGYEEEQDGLYAINDLAVLKLSAASKTPPIRFSDTPPRTGDHVRLFAHGYTQLPTAENQSPISDQLRLGSFTVAQRSECLGEVYHTRDQSCLKAAPPTTSAAFCVGDSGSPVVSSTGTLLGLGSWTDDETGGRERCASSRTPSSWIQLANDHKTWALDPNLQFGPAGLHAPN